MLKQTVKVAPDPIILNMETNPNKDCKLKDVNVCLQFSVPEDLKIVSFSMNQVTKLILDQSLEKETTNEPIKEMLDCISKKLTDFQVNIFYEDVEEIRIDKSSELFSLKMTITIDGYKRCLDLSENPIKKLGINAFNGLSQLTQIILNETEITAIPEGIFKDCSSLETLDLGYNYIRKLGNNSFHRLKKLVTINLNNNKITEIPDAIFKDCTSLLNMDLSHNQIKKLVNGALLGLTSLSEIFLQFNQLTEVPDGMFKIFSSLKRIDLGDNQINIIGKDFLKQSIKLQRINLKNNLINSIMFQSLKPLINSLFIDITNNYLFNSKAIYSFFFVEKLYNSEISIFEKSYSYDTSDFHIVRNLKNIYQTNTKKNYENIEGHFLNQLQELTFLF